ncbi:MAG: glycine cleavage system protein GcvH [Chloroflexi bacterium]|nr:glycine cleavage system protein GcvH [Chloroflexota bacterium]
MPQIVAGLLYTKHDEWLKVEGDEAVIGLTDYAQDALSDIVYLELPDAGDSLKQEDELGVVESVKASSEIFMPVAGEITAVNTPLRDTPETINTDPYGSWLIRLKISDASQLDGLMDAAAYEAYCADR